MADKKDYSGFTTEALLAEEKKIRSNRTLSAVLVGFLTGVIIYGIVTSGFGLVYLFISLGLILLIYKHSQKQQQQLDEVQAALKDRK